VSTLARTVLSLFSFNERNSVVQTNSRPNNQKARDLSKANDQFQVVGDVIKAFPQTVIAAKRKQDILRYYQNDKQLKKTAERTAQRRTQLQTQQTTQQQTQ